MQMTQRPDTQGEEQLAAARTAQQERVEGTGKRMAARGKETVRAVFGVYITSIKLQNVSCEVEDSVLTAQ